MILQALHLNISTVGFGTVAQQRLVVGYKAPSLCHLAGQSSSTQASIKVTTSLNIIVCYRDRYSCCVRGSIPGVLFLLQKALLPS
jgi:hypothetical protein